jgi:hypothetical protein
MCTTTPEPRCRMCGATARLSHSAGPRTSTVRRSVSGVVLSASRGGTRRWCSPARQDPDLGGDPVDELRRHSGVGGVVAYAVGRRWCAGVIARACLRASDHRLPAPLPAPHGSRHHSHPCRSPEPLESARRAPTPLTRGAGPGSAFHGSSTTKSCDRSGRSGFRESCGSAVVPRSASVTETRNVAASSQHHLPASRLGWALRTLWRADEPRATARFRPGWVSRYHTFVVIRAAPPGVLPPRPPDEVRGAGIGGRPGGRRRGGSRPSRPVTARTSGGWDRPATGRGRRRRSR